MPVSAANRSRPGIFPPLSSAARRIAARIASRSTRPNAIAQADGGGLESPTWDAGSMAQAGDGESRARTRRVARALAAARVELMGHLPAPSRGSGFPTASTSSPSMYRHRHTRRGFPPPSPGDRVRLCDAAWRQHRDCDASPPTALRGTACGLQGAVTGKDCVGGVSTPRYVDGVCLRREAAAGYRREAASSGDQAVPRRRRASWERASES